MRSRKNKKSSISSEEISDAVNVYLKNGGKILKLKSSPDDGSRKVYPEKNRSHYEFDSGLDEFNV